MSAVMVSMAVLIRTFSSGILAGRGGTYRAPVKYVTKTWSVVLLNKKIRTHFNIIVVLTELYTGLFKMIVGVLTTCHTQYT